MSATTLPHRTSDGAPTGVPPCPGGHRRRPAPWHLTALLLCLLGLLLPGQDASARAPAASELDYIAGLVERGRYAEAIASLEPIVADAPDAPEPRFLLGNALTGAGRYDEAVDVYVRLTRDFPSRPEPHNNLAVIFVEQGRLDEARTALLAAARLRPGYARAQDNLGDLYLLMAEAAFARAEAIRQAAAGARGAAIADRPAIREPAGAAATAETPTPVRTSSDRPSPAAPETAQPTPDGETTDRRQPSPVLAVADRRAVLAAVERWRAAWNAQDVEGYLDAYASDFVGAGQRDHASWRRQRDDRLRRPEWIRVRLSELRVEQLTADRIAVRFTQRYEASNYADEGEKELVLERTGDDWRIVEERST